MDLIQDRTITCPYCGEAISILIDCSVPQQHYIEDCYVCCRPINLDIQVGDEVYIRVSHENE